MACTYNFKGYTFNSELELDSFLLEKYKYYELFGDLAFSQTTAQDETLNRLLKIQKENKTHWQAYMDILKVELYKHYDEDGDISFEKAPYIGVTRFLSKLEVDGKRLHPEFIEQNYWDRKFLEWKQGKFGKTEQEIRGYKENDTSLTDQECVKLKNEIKTKWDWQAKTGTAIHNVLEIFFSYNSLTKDYFFNHPNREQEIFKLLNKETKELVNGHLDQIIKYGDNLLKKLRSQLGDDILFFTEFIAHSEVNSNQSNALLGKIDLLIYDSKGRIHILDYKTSIKDYHDFSDAKKLAYKYLMATYKRMIGSKGLKTYRSRLYVAPIRIDDFKYDETTKKYTFGNINGDNGIIDVSVQNMAGVEQNIDTFMPPVLNIHLEPNDTYNESTSALAEWFPNYSLNIEITEEKTKKFLEKNGYLKKDDAGLFHYKFRDKTITSNDEVDFIKLVTEFRKTLPNARARITGTVLNNIEDALNLKSVEALTFNAKYADEGESLNWFKDTVSLYIREGWEIHHDEFWQETYGAILLVNKELGIMDILRVSTNYIDLNYKKNLKEKEKGMALTGKYETDALANSKTKSLMLEAANGNVECIEIMAALNASNFDSDIKIRNISVINPYDEQIISPSNLELQYCFNELNKFAPMKWNKFDPNSKDRIEFTTPYEDAYYEAKQIINNHKDLGNLDNDIFNLLNGCTSTIDEIIGADKESKIKALNTLLRKLESLEKKQKDFKAVFKTLGLLQQEHIRLRNSIIIAINNLRGINFRQLLEDHGDWFNSILVHEKGLQGNRIDNPGNLSSETLNLITTLTKQAYQNTRDEVLKFKEKLDPIIKALKEEALLGYVKENLGFNQANLYKNLYDYSDGDFKFKRLNDPTLSPALQKLLEFALEMINKDRFGEEAAKAMLERDDDAYYRVPLAQGSRDSEISVNGWFGALKNKLKSFSPKSLYLKSQNKMEGLRKADEKDDPKTFVFKMTNMFDSGNENVYGNSLKKRKELILETKIENLEHNLETLLLKHVFAYSLQRNIDEVFPLMKGAAIHLLQLGANLNLYFEKDLEYFKDYIWNKVLNKSLIPPNLRNVDKILKFLKLGATRFALAFSPVQGMYQTIQGFWQYASLMARNPDYQKTFTFANFRKAFKIVYKDILDFSGNPTISSRFNELYAINDMDMNSFIERITKNKKGIYNMDNFAMKFSARPDYYNRMIILTSQMLADGTFDAHSLKNGKLIYDWTKDKRFEAFANKQYNHPDYNKLKSLYYAIASLLVNEGVKNEDGSLFELNMNDPKPLPRAYSSKLMEGMKSLADDIYGYYSHENKSLMMSSMIGSMWLQFKTYWSGKKNIYLQGGGVRQRGRWEHYTEKNDQGEIVKWYYRLDENGNPDYNQPPIPDKKPNANYNGFLADTAEKLIAPVIQWKGQWQEGVVISLAQIFKSKNIKQNFVDAWTNEDPDLQKAFHNNIKQIGFDLFMFFIIGSLLGAWMAGWLDDLEDEKKDLRDFITGLLLSAAKISVMSVKNSFADLNFFKSIGSPIENWTPFAFDYWGRVVGRYADVAMGEKNWFDTVVSNFAVGNQMKPLFNVFKPESLRTKREGGTWESRTARKNREKREGK